MCHNHFFEKKYTKIGISYMCRGHCEGFGGSQLAQDSYALFGLKVVGEWKVEGVGE